MTYYQIAAYNADSGDRIQVSPMDWFEDPEQIDSDDIERAFQHLTNIGVIDHTQRIQMRVERIEAIDHPDARLES
jgi:hypothetical protein